MALALKPGGYWKWLAVIFAILVLHYSGLISGLEQFVRGTLVRVWGASRGVNVSIGEHYEFFRTPEEFLANYAVCRVENENNAVQTARVALLEEENNQLRAELNFQKKQKLAAVTAEMIGRESGSGNAVIINRGATDGVMLDQPVIAGEGILVGKIIEVNPESALVRLISDARSRIGATLINRDRSLGVVEGGYGISLKMNLIPRDETVKIGDSVVTSGLEKNIPRGLLIGTVAVVENEPYKPFQQAVLTPSTNLEKLRLLHVLIGP